MHQYHPTAAVSPAALRGPALVAGVPVAAADVRDDAAAVIHGAAVVTVALGPTKYPRDGGE